MLSSLLTFISLRASILLQGVDDPQTVADRRAQHCIIASLKARWPQLTIVGEEARDSFVFIPAIPALYVLPAHKLHLHIFF